MNLKRAIGLVISTVMCVVVMGLAMAQGEKPQPQSPQPPANTSPQLPAATPQPSPPAANPADVASLDSIIAAVYDVISGPAGKKRDWDRMRSLFASGARLIPTGPRPGGGYGSRALSVDDYIQRSSPFFEKEGFYERE